MTEHHHTSADSAAVDKVAQAISLWDGDDWNGILGSRECSRNRYRAMARAAIAAMPNVAQPAQWFPKDMAPQDGTHILVCHGIYSSRDDFNRFPPQVVHWFPDPEAPGFYPSSGIVQDSYNDKPVEFGYWRHLGEPPRDAPLPRSSAASAGAEEAVRDWWYSGRLQVMTSKEAAQALIWHLAKCGLKIVRDEPQTSSNPLAVEVDGCFQAAYCEGLSERLAEADQSPGTLADLVFRRLIPAHQAACVILADEALAHSRPHQRGGAE